MPQSSYDYADLPDPRAMRTNDLAIPCRPCSGPVPASLIAPIAFRSWRQFGDPTLRLNAAHPRSIGQHPVIYDELMLAA